MLMTSVARRAGSTEHPRPSDECRPRSARWLRHRRSPLLPAAVLALALVEACWTPARALVTSASTTRTTSSTVTTTVSAAGKVYWTAVEEEGAGKIFSADPDGGNVREVLSGLRHPSSISVDTTSSKIFWTDSREQTVSRANLDGSDVEVILSGLQNPLGLVVDGPRGSLYFGDWGRVMSSDVDGKNLRQLGAGYMIVATQVSWRERRLYWCDSLAAKIVMYSLDDGSVTDVVTDLDPAGLALDPEKGHLYWSCTSTGAIYRSNLDGSGRELVFSGPISPGEVAMDVKGGRLFWTRWSRDAAVMEGGLDGTGVRVFVTGVRITDVAVV